MYTLPYFPFPISLSFLKSVIFNPIFLGTLGDWHKVESDYLNPLRSEILSYLYELNYFLFFRWLPNGFHSLFIFLVLLNPWFSLYDELVYSLSNVEKLLTVLFSYFLNVKFLLLLKLLSMGLYAASIYLWFFYIETSIFALSPAEHFFLNIILLFV